jgi:hypothetical protein
MENIAPAISPPSGFGENKPVQQAVLDWVAEAATPTQPRTFSGDGSEAENRIYRRGLPQGVLIKSTRRKIPAVICTVPTE